MCSSILSSTASSSLLGFDVVSMSMMFPKVPVMLRSTLRQSREYPAEEDLSLLSPPVRSATCSAVFDLLPRAHSASSMMIMPPRPLLAHNNKRLNSEGPWLLRGKTDLWLNDVSNSVCSAIHCKLQY